MMMVSNLFLLLPVLFAGLYQEWLYFFFAAGLCVFSPLYHWFQSHKPGSAPFFVFRRLDVAFAVGAFIYMYYWVHTYGRYKLFFFSTLTLVVLFFLFVRKYQYKKLHPWFHVVAPLISAAILIAAHL